jgi:hypothetical protein
MKPSHEGTVLAHLDGATPREEGMTIIPQADREDEIAPIDYLVVEFPDGRIGPEGFDALLDLADRGVIDILDVEFVAKVGDAAATRIPVTALRPTDDLNLSIWDGASSGLFDDDDIAEIGARISPDSVAVVVVYENRWVLGLVDAWRRQGARLIADSGVGVDEVIAALDATEPR